MVDIVNQRDLEEAMAWFFEKLTEARRKHGNRAYASVYEILGSLTEEYHEFIEAVHSKKNIPGELLDVAVVAIFGFASLIAIKRKMEEDPVGTNALMENG